MMQVNRLRSDQETGRKLFGKIKLTRIVSNNIKQATRNHSIGATYKHSKQPVII